MTTQMCSRISILKIIFFFRSRKFEFFYSFICLLIICFYYNLFHVFARKPWLSSPASLLMPTGLLTLLSHSSVRYNMLPHHEYTYFSLFNFRTHKMEIVTCVEIALRETKGEKTCFVGALDLTAFIQDNVMTYVVSWNKFSEAKVTRSKFLNLIPPLKWFVLQYGSLSSQ